jgi:hypothetical protein
LVAETKGFVFGVEDDGHGVGELQSLVVAGNQNSGVSRAGDAPASQKTAEGNARDRIGLQTSSNRLRGE